MDFTKNRPGGTEKTAETFPLAALVQEDAVQVVVDVDAIQSVQAPSGYEPVLLDPPPALDSILPEPGEH